MKRKKSNFILQILAILAMILLLFYVIDKFLPEVIVLLKSGNEKEMEEYIRMVGKKGILILVALQFLQTITIFFPGIPIYMASGIVYGKLKGTIICYITYVSSNLFVYCVSKRMGEAAEQLFDNSKQRGITELVKKTKNPVKLIMCLCVLPVIPNGIIPHIAARAKINFNKFAWAVSIGCIPGIFLFVCFGELLVAGHYGIITCIIVISIVGAITFFVLKDKILSWMNKNFSR